MPLPQATVRSYSFAQVVCSVGGLPLSDYGSDGGIAFEGQSDELESQLSADGVVNYSANHDRRIRVTITLMGHSASARYMDSLFRTQKTALESGAPFNGATFYFFNPATAESIGSDAAVIISAPSFSAEKTEGEREYVLELPYGRDGEVVG